MKFLTKPERNRGYTLIEALVASSILLIGISAAASMSLSLVTQEEINERSMRAFNYLDNAARLYQLGVDTGDIKRLLPREPVVSSLNFTSRDVTVTGVGTIPVVRATITYKANQSTRNNRANRDEWTGGSRTTTRTESVEIIRATTSIPSELPRYTANP